MPIAAWWDREVWRLSLRGGIGRCGAYHCVGWGGVAPIV